jgi:hypothetical protein
MNSLPAVHASTSERHHRRTPPARRGAPVLACVLAVALAGLAMSASAQADNVVLTPTTVTLAKATGSTTLIGTSVSGYSNPNQQLLVSISTTLGSVAVTQTSGLTLSYGYSSYSGAEISFAGDQERVQGALATLALSDSGTTGTASVSITVTKQEAGISYLPATGHYYKYVAAAQGTWESAKAGAEGLEFEGQKGYLASIPDATVNNFIEAHLNGASDVWAGGEATDYPSGYNSNTGIKRVWSWRAGPLSETIFTECSNVSETCAHVNDSGDYYDWSPGEPNNSGYPSTGEHYLEINYQGEGKWNDLKQNDIGTTGYVVEFGNLVHGGNFTGVYSNSSEITLANPPDAPTGVTGVGASVEGSSATVSWSAPTEEGNSPITGYTVTASPGGESCTSLSLLTECTITGLDNGGEYTFSVTATNAIGTGTASTESADVTVSGAPGAPGGVSASHGSEQARVSWSPAAENGSALTGYTVTAAPGGATCSTSEATACTVSGLKNGTEYRFTVTAKNGNGVGPSSVSNGVVPSAVPGAPGGVSAVAGVLRATISWTPSAANGSPVSAYKVTAAPEGATCSTTGATSCTITGLHAGTTYTFTVTASNGNGAGPSSVSNGVVPTEPPATPAPHVCVSQRSEMVHWRVRRGQHLRSIVITLNGVLYERLAGSARSAEISLAGRKAETVIVRITATNRKGRSQTSLRVFHPCTARRAAGPPASVYLTPRGSRRR